MWSDFLRSSLRLHLGSSWHLGFSLEPREKPLLPKSRGADFTCRSQTLLAVSSIHVFFGTGSLGHQIVQNKTTYETYFPKEHYL